MALHVGDLVPEPSSAAARSLPDLPGHWTVLYFFPQGNHPYCVMESRRFQQLWPEFSQLGVQLVGVSVDTEEDQKAFRSLCSLQFPVISDAQYDLSRSYEVLETTVHEGKPISYARRETFLIDPQARVRTHWTQVEPNVHAAEVLAAIREVLGAAG